MAERRPKALNRQLECLWDCVEELEAGGGGGGVAGVSSFNSRTGTVTLGSGDVTGALGFTPQTAGDYAAADHNHNGVYALAAHSHVIADVSGLQTALDGKQASGSYSLTSHNHDGVYALAAHTHTIANVTGLQTALDGKAATSHNHVIADVTGLQTALDGKQASGSYSLTSHNHSGVYAPVSHSHAIADVTGLQTALDGKQASGSYALASHDHDGVYALADHTHQGGGADPWTYIKLANDFTTNSATAVDITGLAFTPAANVQYEFEACLFMRTATATVGPKPGIGWPGGVTDAVGDAYASISATTEVQAHGNANASVLAASTALANTTQSFSGRIYGAMKMGGSPSGTLRIQLASETAGTNVTAKAGSFLKYRSI